jgi:hypothetical protein
VQALESFFLGNLVTVFFVYGLSFLVMFGMILWWRRETARFEMMEGFLLLANFGLWHGLTEWADMLRLIVTSPPAFVQTLAVVKLTLLAVSFVYLFLFGLHIVTAAKPEIRLGMAAYGSPLVAAVYGVILYFTLQDLRLGEGVVRITLALPGAGMAGLGLIRLSRTLLKLGLSGPSRDALVAAAGFFCYAVFAGLLFRTDGQPVLLLGIPVQMYRAACAILISVFVVRILAFFRR